MKVQECENLSEDDKAVTEVVLGKPAGVVQPGSAVIWGQSAVAAHILPQSGYVTSHRPSARPQCPALRVTYCFSTRVRLPMLQEPLKLETARVGAHCGLQMFFFDLKLSTRKNPATGSKQAGDILGIQFSLLRGPEVPLTEWVPPFKKVTPTTPQIPGLPCGYVTWHFSNLKYKA